MSAQTVLFDAPGPKARRRYALLTVAGLVLALVTIGLVLWKLQAQGQLDPATWKTLLNPDVWKDYVVPGLINTLKAAAVSIVAAIAFGILFGMGRLSHIAAVRWVCGVIVEFFRAVPVLLMMYFLFQLFAYNNVFASNLNSFFAVVISLTLYNGSVIAELVRSGVHSLPSGQREAGLSIGLTPGQTLRLIQLPQALTAMLPALVGQLVVILKDSALGTAITYPELLQNMRDMGTAYGAVIPAYVLAAVIFILLNYGLTLLAGRVERRLSRRGRGPRRAGPTTGVAGPGTVDNPTDGLGGTGVFTGDATSQGR
ncbi:amino acid ABC transporter permease [Monashia sp. NPDC004114]